MGCFPEAHLISGDEAGVFGEELPGYRGEDFHYQQEEQMSLLGDENELNT